MHDAVWRNLILIILGLTVGRLRQLQLNSRFDKKCEHKQKDNKYVSHIITILKKLLATYIFRATWFGIINAIYFNIKAMN